MKKVLFTAGGAVGGNGVPVRNGLVAEYKFDECLNLLKYSQQFDNAAWTKSDCAITANDAAAPDGTTTADKVTLTVGAAQSVAATYAVTAATVYTFSIWVKLGTAAAAKYAIYDLTHSADIAAATSYAATTSWARYTYSFTTPAGCISISVRPIKDCGVNNGETLWIWGAQLEGGSAATTYVPTTNKQWLKDYVNNKNLIDPTVACGGENTTAIASFFAAHLGTETITSSAEQAWNGTRSLKVVTPGNVADEGALSNARVNIPCRGNSTYTASAYIYGSGDLQMGLSCYSGATKRTQVTTALTAGAAWTRYTATITTDIDGDQLQFFVTTDETKAAQAVTFYIDGVQVEQGSAATTWVAPKNLILGGEPGSSNDPTWTTKGALFTANTGIYDYTEFNSASVTIQSVIIPNINTDANRRIFERGDGNCFAFAAGSKIAVWVGAWYKSAAVISANIAYSPAFTFNGATLKIYNGVSCIVDSAVVYAMATGYRKLYVGMDNGLSQNMEGEIAYIVMYDRVLSQSEINKNYAYLKSYLKKQRGISLP